MSRTDSTREPRASLTAPLSGHDLPAGRPGPSPAVDDTLTLSFDDNRLLAQLFGEHDEHLALIEQRLGVNITPRGNHIAVRGTGPEREGARRALAQLYDRARRGLEISRGDVEGAIRMTKDEDVPAGEMTVRTRRKLVVPRTPRQRAYVEAIRRHELVFGTGPAGTGKTYLAVACAASALMAG